MDEYAPLWCKSNFSFLEGASHPEELVEEAHRVGIRSIAITDRDGVYGMVRAHVKAKELGVHLLCGAEITIAASSIRLGSSRYGAARAACSPASSSRHRRSSVICAPRSAIDCMPSSPVTAAPMTFPAKFGCARVRPL